MAAEAYKEHVAKKTEYMWREEDENRGGSGADWGENEGEGLRMKTRMREEEGRVEPDSYTTCSYVQIATAPIRIQRTT